MQDIILSRKSTYVYNMYNNNKFVSTNIIYAPNSIQ